MKTKLYIITLILFLLSACGTQSAPAARPNTTNPPIAAITQAPTDVPLESPTASPVPTETALPTETAIIADIPTAEIPGLFGMLNSADVQAGLMLEPVVSQIFELKLQEWVEAGQIEEFQVERLGVYSKGDGTLYAEIFFRVKTDGIFWPEDGGILGADGWITGKCVRFDFVITADAYQLLNKRLCS